MVTTEPCSLEQYTRVRAELTYRRGPDGKTLDVRIVLEEHGYTCQSWVACKDYWTPRVSSNAEPEFDIAASLRFLQLMKQEAHRLTGAER
jgi:hypothetical protein